ncbi:uncharacterized protein LY89DRAFT_739561 [Mollisia scopiformis]|uniref:Uncharacterized protein n=1 Tax=Mollisia scopiformis TaxID=149040 RepID=A0A194WTT9_MOLSC|nr:uncharacterized protein LY89DRAFT_739561 [Mollisia scopiformis]KUJ11370.1 hypothetical protein LY89DRAFT_739561 [Mollisia scopiformis]
MPPTIYFGVELEFCLGYPANGQTGLLATSPLASSSFASPPFSANFTSTDSEEVRKQVRDRAARAHIGRTFLTEGLPYKPSGTDNDKPNEDPDHWSVKDDDSILEGGPRPDYSCRLRLSDKLVTSSTTITLPMSCGLHVHFSFGKAFDKNVPEANWTFERLKKLMMFFWVFEDHFDTLHSTQRRKDRHRCYMVMRRHTPISSSTLSKGLNKIKNTTSVIELARLVSREEAEREMAVSIYHIAQRLSPGHLIGLTVNGQPKAYTPTVEFRRHKGTLSFAGVSNWIKTLAGVILWLEDKNVNDLPELLMELSRRVYELSKEETEGQDGGDETRDGLGSEDGSQKEVRERKFPIIELLKSIGLDAGITGYYYRELLVGRGSELRE